MRLKTRHQEHLALAVMAALATVVFEIWPRLDLAVSGYFFDGTAFVGHQWGWAQLLYLGVPPLGTWLVALALAVQRRAGAQAQRGQVPLQAQQQPVFSARLFCRCRWPSQVTGAILVPSDGPCRSRHCG